MISCVLNFGDGLCDVVAENGAAARSTATEPEPVDTVVAALSAQIETISDRIRRALECPVCLLVATKMTCFCPNGHAVCQTCLVQLWTNADQSHCPTCRSLLMPTSDTSATNDKLSEVLKLVRVTCTNRRFGCAELPIVRALNEHETACPYKPNLQCHVSVCQWTGIYDQLFDHVRQMHPGDVFVDQSKNSMILENLDHIFMNRCRRAYLIRTPWNLIWLKLFRLNRSIIQVGLYAVEKPGMSCLDPTNLSYRVTWKDPKGKTRTRSIVRQIAWSSVINNNIRSPSRTDNDPNMTIWTNVKRIEIHWFRSLSTQILMLLNLHGRRRNDR